MTDQDQPFNIQLMSTLDSQLTQSDDTEQLPPPSGDSEKADKYINQLTNLVGTDKLLVLHTDLSKFDPTSLQDHYRLDLGGYEIEISHNKQAESGQDCYIILFNNLKSINNSCSERVILAYMHLTEQQFTSFKSTADDQLDRKRKETEEKRFKEAMAPIDQALEQLADNTPPLPALDNRETTAVASLS